MKKKNVVCVFGHFGSKQVLLNGQSIKAAVLAQYIEHKYGPGKTKRADTSGGWSALLKIPVCFFQAILNCNNVVVVPAYKGIQLFAFLIAIVHHFTNTKYHYAVVGGWLPSYINKHNLLAKRLHLFDGIYVETNTTKRALENKGYKNIYLMPNSKELEPVKDCNYSVQFPLRLCTFSRVGEDKGIFEAAQVIKHINTLKGETILTLDIYGPIKTEDQQWFESNRSTLPEYIKYKGVVPFDKSVEVLKDYFMLLFPTKAYTEGVPGTIIDAYAAGLPVLASRWESFTDVIEDGITGIGFEFGNLDEMKHILEDIISNPQVITNMRTACVNKSRNYLPEIVFSTLTDNFA